MELMKGVLVLPPPLQNPASIRVHPVRMTSIAMSKAAAALMGYSATWRMLETLAVGHLRIHMMTAGCMTMTMSRGIKKYNF